MVGNFTHPEVISRVQDSLKQLPEKRFFACFKKWIERWHCYISSEDRYFEKLRFIFDVNDYLEFFQDFYSHFLWDPCITCERKTLCRKTS